MMVRLRSYVLTLVLSLTLASDGPFFFTQQPLDAELQEGEEASLYCIVSPVVGVRYTWYWSLEFKGEESVIEDKLEPLAGKEAPVWFEKSISRDATGYYHCKVETDDYKLFSNTAFVRVKYFTLPASSPVTQTRELSNNQEKEYLPCDTLESSPIMDITWTKNDKPISHPRLFVFPEDIMTSQGSQITRGTLLIINVIQGEDDATYKCLTKEAVQIDGGEAQQIVLTIFEVRTTSGANPINKAPKSVFKSYNAAEGNVQIVSGGEVILVCAGEGYPTPSYEWYEQSDDGKEVQIRGSDSLLLEDQNRRLVASNILHPKTYICKMVNLDDGRSIKRPNNFYIKTIGDSSDYNIDILQGPTRISVLKPNQYTPFTLECSVRKTGQIQILWLKNGEKMVWNARITTDDSESVVDGGVATSRNLLFETTNESDLGVYQCVIFNSQRLKVETAYVTLEKDSLPDISARDPQYEFLRGPFSVDEAEEECNSRDGHLVSILDERENKRVHELLQENNSTSFKVDSVWIGLTREVPQPVGYWLWTQSGDISTAYSNWHEDKPDNKYGHQEYTVMSASNGRWVDVDRNSKRPAVCKRYVVVCPSVDEFYDGRLRVQGWESVGATYEVGEKVEVSCRFPGDKELSVPHVTCRDNRKFTPDTLDECPEVPSSYQRHSSDLALLAMLLFLLSTSSL